MAGDLGPARHVMELGLAVDKLSWNPTASNAWAMTRCSRPLNGA
jgi:hypothetical protein